MIRESPELKAVAQRWVDAYIGGQGAALANLVSRDEATRYIGTDPDEVWTGTDVATVLPVHIAEIQERVAPKFEPQRIEAWEEGTAGWAVVIGSVAFGDTPPRDMRMILLFALEVGMWRVVLAQNSIAVPNPDVVGVEITRGIEALLGEMGDHGESTIRDAVSEGTVALMFTDIVDSTAWLTQLGDDDWARLVGWHDDMVRETVGSHGGVVVKTLGDGAMAAFDSTRSAARAAREIQVALAAPSDRPDIEVRIGLHVGEVLVTGEDYLGRAVNKAARIASAATGGQIYVSNAVAALLGDDPEFEFGESTRVVLKGLDGTHEIVPLLWR